MNDIEIIFPVKEPSDLRIASKVKSRQAFVNFENFLQKVDEETELVTCKRALCLVRKEFARINEYIEEAQKYNVELFITFSNTLTDLNASQAKDFIDYLEKIPEEKTLGGIMINTLSLLEYIKFRELPFKIIIDSSFDIHNLSGIEFVKIFHKIDKFILSEEVYLKNIEKIKKATKMKIGINSSNIPWIAEDILKSKTVDTVIINGDFQNQKELLKGVELVEKIIENPRIYKNKKLPFKQLNYTTYETNHFTGEFLSTKGKDFKFSGNINSFEWKYKTSRLKKEVLEKNFKIPKLALRFNSLNQIDALKRYIKKLGFNPVYAIEFGEILSTSDLSKGSFNQILDTVKEFCIKNDIKLQLSTPRILIERDFDRVYEYVKQLFDDHPPFSLIVNNLGFWWSAINDTDYSRIPIELGSGLNLWSGESILCLNNQREVESIELSNFIDIRDTKTCINTIKHDVKYRKLTVGGSIRIPCSGLCPLNRNSAILSRLSCKAPCHKGLYSVTDKDRNKTYTLAVDGFCRMHLFRDKILDLFKYTRALEEIGVNEFVIDFYALDAKLVPVLINRFLNAICDEDYKTDENFLDKLYYLNYYMA